MIKDTTKIEACSDIILQWLNTCLKSHPICAQMSKSDWYPTRLLDLGNSHADSDDPIKLIHTRNKSLSGPYVTLSHCWGGASIIKLTTATLAQFSKGIALVDLPKTFVDAICTARFLKIRYIWIDSLTIIQDSTDDWAQESSMMGQVYQNSFCNLGATASSNSSGGLFFERNPEVLRPYRICSDQREYQLTWTGLWGSGIDFTPLIGRAWVFQERWLCPRMLHFSSEQVFWECRQVVACEIHPGDAPTGLYDKFKFDDGSIAWKGDSTRKVTKTERNQLANLWRDLVYNYSLTKLTFDTDKLIALCGIAKLIQQELNDEYLAGMWKNGLIVQLGWTVLNGGGEVGNVSMPARSTAYTAPSWSWASVKNGEISYPVWPTVQEAGRFQELSSLTDYHLEWSSQDQTGQVSSGYLQICGPLTEVSVVKTSEQTFPFHRYQVLINNVPIKEYITMDVMPEGDNCDISLVFLALYRTSTSSTTDSKDRVVGLLLQPVLGSETLFSRVGRLEIGDPDWVRWCVNSKEIASLAGADFHPDHGYTIKIV